MAKKSLKKQAEEITKKVLNQLAEEPPVEVPEEEEEYRQYNLWINFNGPVNEVIVRQYGKPKDPPPPPN